LSLGLSLIGCGQDPTAANSAVQDEAAPLATQVALTTSTLQVKPAGAVSLSAQLAGAQNATYQWTQTAPTSPLGTFATPTAGSTTWQAPVVAADTVVTLVASITDTAANTTSTATVQILVSAAATPATLTANVASQVAGGIVQLSFAGAPAATATTQPTYSFSQSSPAAPAGSFSNPSGAGTQWHAPAVAADTAMVLQGAATLGQVTVVAQQAVTVQTAQYARDVQPIWQQKCVSCHNASHASAGFDATSVASMLANVSLADCGSGARIVAGNAEASPLFNRIRGTCAGGGKQMPANDKTYFNNNPDALAKVQSWILAGAHNN
jgi:hypothetical protein